MQAGVVDAMERANNPARVALTIREQVESRLSEAKQEWQLQWSGERRRLLAEIERLKKGAAPGAVEEKKEAARRALLEKLGKLPAGSGGAASRTADQWEQEFEDAKIQWETDREHLNLKIKKLEMDLQLAQDGVRAELFQELQAQYEPKLAEASRERQRLELEAQAATSELSRERQRLNARIEQLERAIPEAQESARKQALAELQGEYDMRIEEANRARARLERKQQDLSEEFSAEQRRAKKQIASLQEQLKEAKDAVYNAQKGSGRGSSPSD
jgi:hypothetical protein